VTLQRACGALEDKLKCSASLLFILKNFSPKTWSIMRNTSRNDPCPCGSGKQYAQCCLPRNEIHALTISVPKALREALTHQQSGRLQQAEAIYLQILDAQPNHPDALHLLGMVAHEDGRDEMAVDLIGRAIRAKPSEAMYHNNLGMALEKQGKLDAAVESLRRALSLKPGYAKAHYNLGSVLQTQGKLDAAVASYHNAILCQPIYAEAHYNMGRALKDLGILGEAVGHYQKAITFKPDYAEAHNSLGNMLYGQDRLDEALEHYHKAQIIKPDYAEPHNSLGNVLQTLGRLDEAVESYRTALAIKPEFSGAYSSLLFLYGYQASLDPQEYLSLARGWERACLLAEDRQRARDRRFWRPPLAGRRLKVGYVSGDYRQHAVSYFIEQLFARHDRTRIELFAYSTQGQRDATTERLQSCVDHWIPVAGIPDVALRERIGQDSIDVLVDLSGHTNHTRLSVFAHRAAPVQVHYLGYFASTGLTEMDYLIGDNVLTPAATDSHMAEHVWRLPRIRASYQGAADAPEPDWHPAEDDSIWLGSFNNLGKITPQTLALWAKVLHALPEGKLLLKTKELADAGNRQRILDAMTGHGIAPGRIELQDRSVTPGWREHMAYYDRLDIVLDSIGAHGGYTTTCDALWMGAPVITLAGDRMATRMAASILDAVGHPEWIARNEAEYVEKVVALARDVEQRITLRPAQRDQMASSPLCDAKGLAMSLEHAYFEMFERWLRKQNGVD
jgi:protein O-GlcNAc transferase